MELEMRECLNQQSIPLLQTFDGVDLYFFETDKIARLSYGLVMDHPFFDGNKRIAAAALDLGLSGNGLECHCHDEKEMAALDLGLSGNGLELKAAVQEMIDEFVRLASGEIKYNDFLDWVEELSLPKEVKALRDMQRKSSN